jgi:hypothetical protein
VAIISISVSICGGYLILLFAGILRSSKFGSSREEINNSFFSRTDISFSILLFWEVCYGQISYKDCRDRVVGGERGRGGFDTTTTILFRTRFDGDHFPGQRIEVDSRLAVEFGHILNFNLKCRAIFLIC